MMDLKVPPILCAPMLALLTEHIEECPLCRQQIADAVKQFPLLGVMGLDAEKLLSILKGMDHGKTPPA